MIEVNILNTKGAEVGKLALNPEIFGKDYNEALIHQVVVAQLANKRQGNKSTLTRTEVRGGGIKPYRQKGTGRARQGSIRAPQYVKGGVVFAPKPRDFSKKINKNMKTAALYSVLSEKVRAGEFIVIDNDAAAVENGKTKEIAAVLKALSINKRALLVLATDNDLVLRASGNIQGFKVENVSLLNVYDLVAAKYCIISVDAVKKIGEVEA
ncbi:MAG: 50S ribosomal protein L4 [Clostridiaceae bacterium]|jgi:large subunit ribosomal protein L4|nr:50S ribosomal protein L4 [Clostridiaceae bacterium]